MPAATTQADLIAVTDKEWAKLCRVLDKVPHALNEAKDADGVSIKDVLTHRAHWSGLFFQWLEEGEAAQMPDHGVKWNQLKPYNAGLRETYADMTYAEARDWLTDAHRLLSVWMAATPEDVLYGGPMPGGTGWTRGRYAEAAGPSHYRSAATYIRKRLRTG